jgi:hypothetical protein
MMIMMITKTMNNSPWPSFAVGGKGSFCESSNRLKTSDGTCCSDFQADPRDAWYIVWP